MTSSAGSVADSDITPTSPNGNATGDADLAFSLDNLSLLVEDIKDGFASAMKQLSSIQNQDEEFQRRLETTEANTQRKMEALHLAVDQMREQFSSLLTRVESLELHHRRLEGQVDRLDRVQTEQQGGLQNCQRQPALERESAACQTPLIPTPYSCPTPLSPDSGRPGTCTPSCFHGNELLTGCGESHGSAQNGQAAAEKTLSMSRALADQIASQASGCSVRCELHKEDRQVDEDLTDQLSECSNSGSIISGTTGAQHERQKNAQLLSEKRSRICQEIVDTERRYCSDLWTIIDLIAESLKSATFITMKDLCLIFPKCLPRLYDLHSTFLGLLEAQLASANEANQVHFAGVFIDFLDANNGELFELYRRYANEFGSAVRTIRAYQQQSARFRCLQLSLQRHPSCGGLDLTAFLLTPVQRLPRYLLLMRQLSVHTQQSHGDRLGLDRVLSRLHSLLDELNYSIQTALKEAQQQQQQQSRQQQRWKRSLSLTRSSVASTCEDLARGDEADGGSSGRLCQTHFIASNSRCRSATPSSSSSQVQSAARCYSGGLAHFGGSQSALATQQRHSSGSPANMGPRSRLISRQLRYVDRCVSASDILRGAASPSPSSSPAPSPAPSATTSMASPLADDRPQLRRTGRSSTTSAVAPATMSHLKLAHKSTPTLKESFRRMFQSRRKSSQAKLGSLPPVVNCSDTFEDENGDPCTDV